MKRVFAILALIVLLLIAAIAILPLIFKDDIIKLAKEEANKTLNATVDFGEFDLSIISTFPDFKFSINNVSVMGTDQFEGTKLVSIGELSTVVDIQSVIDGEQIKVKSILLADVDANVMVTKNGVANYDIVKSTGEETETTEESTEATSFSLALEEYEFRNINVKYNDNQGDINANIINFNHKGNGDFTQDIFELNTTTSIDEITCAMEGVKYLNKANIVVKFDTEIDNPNSKYTFKENTFSINSFDLSFDGWVAMPNENDINMDLKFGTNKPDFKSLLSLVPAIYLTDFESIETAGEVQLSGFAKGTYNETQLPAFDVDLIVDKAMFHYPDLPKSVENIAINVKAKNPGGSEDNTVVNIKKFHMEMGANPVDIAMLVKTPVSDPDMDGKILANIDLASMKDFIPVEEGEEYNGNIAADVKLAGRISTIDNEDYENFLFEGNVKVKDMKYKSADVPYGVTIHKMNVEFSPQFVAIKNLDSKVGKSDFKATGKVENFLAYTFKDETLAGNLSLKSNSLNLNDFMEEEEEAVETETSENTETETTEEGVIEVPSNIDFVMDLDIKELIYDDMTFDNMKGKLEVKESVVNLDHLTMNLFDGKMGLNGTYSTQNEAPEVDFNYDIKRIEVTTAYKAFQSVDKMAPAFENAQGKVSTDLHFMCKLDNNMEVDLNTLTGDGVLHTHNVIVNDSETLKQLANMLKQPKYSELKLNDNKIFYEFKEGRIFVQPFDVNAGKSKFTTSGSQGFDESMDYTVKMDIPTSMFGNEANNLVNGLLSQGNQFGVNAQLPERIKVDALIKGTLTDPKITLGNMAGEGTAKESIQEQVKEAAVEKAKEVINNNEDVKKAKEQAAKLVADAEKQANTIRKQGKTSADKLRKEGYAQADKLVKDAKNPLEKAGAKIAAEKLKKETDKKADQVIKEADKQAKAVVDTAKKQADEILKKADL